ncbi:hypothetical protein [uncultured Clostridium sp.]|jgi:hypothetical protein|uniref:hypothetical protein n=1 Tax=uncultured Clostridium sp. TaxID=59620 RepID=UPI0020513D5A|nr:hypothetical protein [uncultured Clostridium sp.]DAV65719.1 MAG TPA: hypothetical protein [Caudoviricetes sp.]
MNANTVNKNTAFGSGLIYLVDSFDVAQLDTEITSKLIDDNLLILTDDGVNFEEEKEIFSTQLAGFNEKRVSGYETVVRAEGKISGTGRLVNAKLLEASLYKKEENNSTKYDVYRVEEGIIASDKYKDVVMVATNKATEKAQIIILHNAYNSNLSLETKGSDDGSCKLEFASAYDKDNLNKVPYEICTLKEV